MRVDFNSASNGSGLFCNGVESFNTTSSLTSDNNQQLTPGAYFDYTFSYNSLSGAHGFLYIGGFLPYINGTATSWILIKKVTIIEIPPPISFTLPASTTFGCGTTTPQTFTVTNVYGTTGITNYTWNLGSASNNWLYNGSPAPQTISTGTTGSIPLTPVCGAVQSNISATVTANGNTYNTNTSTVSTTPPTISINGSNTICSGSSSYQIDGLPCNSMVVWSASPLGVVSFNPNANPVTLTQTGNGTITLTATISNVCGGNPIVISKSNIIVGAPTAIGIDFGAGGYTNMEEDCGDAAYFKVLYNAADHNYSGYLYVTASNATSLSWTVVSNSSIPYWGWSTSNNGHTLYVSQKSANKSLSLKVTATNACGSINNVYFFNTGGVCPVMAQSTGGGANYLLAPNPAGNNVTISVNSAAKNSEAVSFAQIQVYDGIGNLKKQLKYGSGTRHAQINITDLKPGYYYVEIGNGKTAERKPLVVQR